MLMLFAIIRLTMYLDKEWIQYFSKYFISDCVLDLTWQVDDLKKNGIAGLGIVRKLRLGLDTCMVVQSMIPR